MYTVLHNPRCTKSRNAISLLEDKGFKFTIREYLEDPLNEKELKELMLKAQFEIKELIRSKEAKEFGVNLGEASDINLLKSIAKYPKIMQRPVVIKGKKAVIARTEDWLKTL